MRRQLILAALLIASGNALVRPSARLTRSVLLARPLHTAVAPFRRPADVTMAGGDGDDGILGALKRRGEQLGREISEAAERLGDVLDEGLDVVLGPRAAPGLVPIPIPIPVDRDPYGGRYGGRDVYDRY